MKTKQLIVALIVAFLFTSATISVGYAQRKGDGRPTTANGQASNKDGQKLRQKDGKIAVIAVATAASGTDWTKELTEAEIERALSQGGRFRTLSRGSLDAVLQEQKRVQSDLFDPNKGAEVGKLVGADYIVYGKCLTVENKEEGFSALGVNKKSNKVIIKVQMQLLDVETGDIVDTFSYNEKAEASSTSVSGYGSNSAAISQKEVYGDKIKDIATNYIGRIQQLIPIEASIVLTKGNEAAIDLGENGSVKPGMEFEVFTEGQPIKNSAGEVLGYDRTKHGLIRIVRVEPKLAWGSIVQTFGDNGQADSTPNPARIQRDFTAKQANIAKPTSTSSTATTPTTDTTKKDKDKDKDKKSSNPLKKLPF